MTIKNASILCYQTNQHHFVFLSNFGISLWILCVFFVLITVYLIISAIKCKCWFRSARLAFNLSGPPALPLLGNIFMLKNTSEFIKYIINAPKLHGSIIRGWITIIPIVAIFDPRQIQIILGSTKQTDKNFLYAFMHTFLGEGLLTNSGRKWKLHRKFIQPYFHLNTLKLFINTFKESSDLLVEQLQNKKEIKITTFINNCVLNILHHALLGIPVKDYNTKLISPFNKGHLVILQRILRPWYIFDFAYKFSSISKHEIKQQLTLQEFARKILDQRRRCADKIEWCLLDSFIKISENNPQFTDESIVNEICTFMLAGQDSVGAAVSFTLYNLAKHPDVQQNVVEELERVFNEYSEINMDCLNDMVYLEQCIKESLRLFPSVPLFAKKLVEDVQLDNHVLPAGLNIFIAPITTHRLEEYYPNPDKFDPDRFSIENQRELHPYAFIPFSAGPRNCIGNKFAYLEMKTIIASILRHYVISVPPSYELELMYRVTLRAKGGIHLHLKPR